MHCRYPGFSRPTPKGEAEGSGKGVSRPAPGEGVSMSVGLLFMLVQWRIQDFPGVPTPKVRVPAYYLAISS